MSRPRSSAPGMPDTEERRVRRTRESGGREEYMSPHKQQMLQLLDDDIRRGSGIVRPGPAIEP